VEASPSVFSVLSLKAGSKRDSAETLAIVKNAKMEETGSQQEFFLRSRPVPIAGSRPAMQIQREESAKWPPWFRGDAEGPLRLQAGTTLASFLNNHREAIAAMDFFTVPTLAFGVLYCFS
jgi:hypothetical protein